MKVTIASKGIKLARLKAIPLNPVGFISQRIIFRKESYHRLTVSAFLKAFGRISVTAWHCPLDKTKVRDIITQPKVAKAFSARFETEVSGL